jgi:hypothetical protein
MARAKDTNQTAVAPKPESRNFVPLAQSDIDSMSYNQLDGFVTDGCKDMKMSSKRAKEIRETLEPAIIRMHGLLTNQGGRTDLADVPTWEGWMKKHEAFGSRRAFYRILAKAKVLPVQVGDAYITPDNQVVTISQLHSTALDKVDVEIDLHDGSQPVTKTYSLKDLEPLNPMAVYCATTPHGWDVDVAISAAHKLMRRGDESNAIYFLKQLYWTNEEGRCKINLWKQVLIYPSEDIGNADLTVKTKVLELYRKVKRHLEELEEIAAICKDGERHSDLGMLVHAMMICCRAEKSRAVDNAIIWFKEHPTYKAPIPEEVESAVKTNQPKPVIPEDSPIYDMHTKKGRRMGRKGKAGLDHFLKEGAKLENKSSIPDFQPPVTVVDPEKTVPTEGGL